jgi:hypothetical protein
MLDKILETKQSVYKRAVCGARLPSRALEEGGRWKKTKSEQKVWFVKRATQAEKKKEQRGMQGTTNDGYAPVLGAHTSLVVPQWKG